jgi:hypothetical protein
MAKTMADDPESFKDTAALQDYVEAHGLMYVWAGTTAFSKRQRELTPEQFNVRPVQTTRGLNYAGLFSKSIQQAEWEADAPRRAATQAKRVARRKKEGVV